MDYKIVIEPTAERDLQEVLEWYFKKEKHLPSNFLTKFNEAIEQVLPVQSSFRKDMERQGLFLHIPIRMEYITY